MKLFGYVAGAVDQHTPVVLTEMTVQASSEEIRAIATLLADIANEMEQSRIDHVHLNDRIPALEEGPQFIVARAI